MPVLSPRALNRATLQRQLLLAPSTLAPVAAVERLAGLHHQTPNAPYWALWTRLSHFDPAHLTRLMHGRRLLRCAAMRGTLHLLSARDLLSWRPRVQHVLMRALVASHGRFLEGLDLAALGRAARELACAEPLTMGQIGERLAARWPGHDRNALGVAARCAEPLLHVPPAGTWDCFTNAWLLPADVWLDEPLGRETAPDPMILRYLAAFGPAAAPDIGAWSGLTSLKEPLERLAPQLRRYHDDQGRVLYDLRRARLPDPGTPAPVRLIGEFDNLVLAHTDRSVIVDPAHRARVITVNGLVQPCVLIDGRVQGTWKIERGRASATLGVSPFRRLNDDEKRDVAAQAERALAFAGLAGGKVHFNRPG